MQITKNFNLSEFRSKDGKDFPLEVIKNIRVLAVQLQAIRDSIGKPIIINSGYRSPEHNKKVGGAVNSFHVKGMAVDFRVNGMSQQDLFNKVEELIKSGAIIQGGLGLYSSWVHYDIRGIKARWKNI
jgi:uncharacterized protein YcbK (DUF882 family)